METPIQNVIIIGAGLGVISFHGFDPTEHSGLALARALQKKGIKFSIYERDASESSRPQGYQLGLNQEGTAVLKEIELHGLVELLNYNNLKKFTVVNSRGYVLLRLGNNGMSIVNRWTLRDLLAEGLEIQWNKKFTSYEEKDGKVTAYFEDGTSAIGDVLVGADGSHSLVRRQRCPSLTYDEVGVIYVAGFLPLLPPDSIPNLHRLLTDSAIRIFGPEGSSFLLIRYKDDEGKAHLLWSMSMTQERFSPENDEWRSFVLRISQFNPEIAQVIEMTPVENLLSPRAMHSISIGPGNPMGQTSRVTLLGDAAHAMTTQAGLGGNTALQDSLDLAQALSSPDWFRALASYEIILFERGFRNADRSLKSTRMLHMVGWKAGLRDTVGWGMWACTKLLGTFSR